MQKRVKSKLRICDHFGHSGLHLPCPYFMVVQGGPWTPSRCSIIRYYSYGAEITENRKKRMLYEINVENENVTMSLHTF